MYVYDASGAVELVGGPHELVDDPEALRRREQQVPGAVGVLLGMARTGAISTGLREILRGAAGLRVQGDNDGDGSIDLEDRQCLNAEQNSEKNRKR